MDLLKRCKSAPISAPNDPFRKDTKTRLHRGVNSIQILHTREIPPNFRIVRVTVYRGQSLINVWRGEIPFVFDIFFDPRDKSAANQFQLASSHSRE